MRKLLLLVFVSLTVLGYSQNVGIGISTPNSSAKLDITSTNSGLLIPRVALTMTTAAGPVTAPANSLVVYNTATAADVTPGFYYWDSGTATWTRFATGSTGWGITGNSGIGASNFLGTINAADLIIRTTNVERMRVLSGGNVGIGTNAPAVRLDVNGDFSLREGTALALANGANATIAPGTSSHIRITGPTAAFSIAGLTGGVNGKMITIINTTTFPMSILNNSAATVANGFYTPGAVSMVLADQYSSATFIYNSTLARWLTVSQSTENSTNWLLTGNAGTNDPASPVTYGTSTIAASENWIGSSDANDLVFGTNTIERFRIKQTTGYVGVGTATPSNLLSINNSGTTVTTSTTYPIAIQRSGTTDLTLGSDASYAYLQSWNSKPLSINSQGNNVIINPSAGSVAIGSVAPNTKLDVNGDFALREGLSPVLANGANGTIAPGATSHMQLTGPTAAFSIAGLTGGVNGKIITLINTTAYPLTILNNAAVTLANGIYTPGGTGLVLENQYASITLIYNSSLSRWIVKTYADKDGTQWMLTGNTGINDPAAPVTYGTSTIAGTENWIGTTDANDVVIGTNNIERLRVKQTTGFVGIGTAAPSQALEIGGAGEQIYMNSTTSNMLYFNTSGVASPAFTTRSAGTKIVLYPQISATTVDYALGITGSTLWASVPEATSTYSHRWYAGTSELMRLRGDGRLAIGTAAPNGTRLDCYDASTATARVAVFRNGTVDGTEVQIGSIEYFHDYSGSTDFNDGFAGVGFTINYGAASGYDLQLLNNSAAKPGSNAWTVVSDSRLKEDVTPFKDGLEVVRAINPIYYKYNGKAKTPKDEYYIGILAQDMKEIAPYTVSTFEYMPDEKNPDNLEEYYSFNSGALDFVTLNAIKELDEKQNKVEAILKNISDFGMTTLSNGETFVPFASDFANNLNPSTMPVVTITPVNSDAQVSVISQNEKGFFVKIVSSQPSVNVNWIAMAKIKEQAIKVEKIYSSVERNAMLEKVKIKPSNLKGRIAREYEELRKEQIRMSIPEKTTLMPKDPIELQQQSIETKKR